MNRSTQIQIRHCIEQLERPALKLINLLEAQPHGTRQRQAGILLWHAFAQINETLMKSEGARN